MKSPKRSENPFQPTRGPADSIFYLQKGRAKLTVVSKNGKEATITLISPATSLERSRLPERSGFNWRPPPSSARRVGSEVCDGEQNPEAQLGPEKVVRLALDC